MHSALVIIEQPPSLAHPTLDHLWRRDINDLNTAALKHEKVVQKLGDGCALVSMAQGANALSDVLRAAESSSFPYRLLFFKKEPRWIRTERLPVKT